MLASAAVVGLVGTTDSARARHFYGDVLGLVELDETPFACVFDANGTTLRVTLVEQVVAAPYTVLGWVVPDVAETIRGLVARGVVFDHHDGMRQDDLGIWESPSGARVAWFKDPDGNILSLTQLRV